MEMASEVGGLDLANITAAPQAMPAIYSKVDKLRSGDLGRQWSGFETAAITLEPVIRRRRAIVPVREQNGLTSDALVVIDGCCKDDLLDNLWERRKDHSLYELFLKEEPCVLIAPDISLYAKMSACHKLYQMKRSFKMYARYQRHGLTAIPFIAPDSAAHAKHLAAWLTVNKCVSHVATSFQTFRARRDRWRRHMILLRRIRDAVPRDLVWLVIGQGERRREGFERTLGNVRFITTEDVNRRYRHTLAEPCSLELPLGFPSS